MPAPGARIATEDVRLGGPWGTAQGLDALRGWIARAGIRLVPVARHAVGPGRGPGGVSGVVVAEEDATLPGRADADPLGPAVQVFSAHLLRNGTVAAVLRHDSLPAALDAARGLLGRP